MRDLERNIMLRVLDEAWKDHLLALDHLKEGISLRGYGQRDPLTEYKRESFELFRAMKTSMEDRIVSSVARYEPPSKEELVRRQRMMEEMRRRFQLSAPAKTSRPTKPTTVERSTPKVGRNDPCPCGSGKKYKRCHGAPGVATA